MASIQVLIMCLSLFVLSQLMKVEAQSTSLISRESVLRPNTSRSSWLSSSRHFAFGFHPQGNGLAVGIWLVDNPDNITVVWTANRNDPPVLSNSTIEFTKDGELLLRTGQHEDPTKTIAKPYDEKGVSASMNDSGNFIIYNNSSEVIWESFHCPTDTLLGGQSMSYYRLNSGKSTSDHSRGRFYLGLESLEGRMRLLAYPANHTDARITPRDFYWEIKSQYSNGLTLNLTDGVLQLTRGNLTVRVIANISYKSVMNEALIYRATLDADGILRL